MLHLNKTGFTRRSSNQVASMAQPLMSMLPSTTNWKVKISTVQPHSRAYGPLLLPATAMHQCSPVKRLTSTGCPSNTIWSQRSRN